MHLKISLTVITTALLMVALNSCSKAELTEKAQQHARSGVNHLTSSTKVDINSFLSGVIENFRIDMITGISNLRIPVLDPFKVKEPFDAAMNSTKANVFANFSDTVVQGISGFEIDSMEVDLTNLSIEFHLRVPWMKGLGRYSLEGKVFKIFPISGNGRFWVGSSNLILVATASLETLHGNHYQLSDDFNLMIGFDKVDLYLEEFLGGGRWSEKILKLLKAFKEDVLIKCLSFLQKDLNKSLLKVINNDLLKLPITSIIPRSSANEYLDQILENLQVYLEENNMDPIELPDYFAHFSKGIVFMNVTGEANLHDGWLWGISTLHRTDDCDLNTNKTTISVSANLGLNNLKLAYIGQAKFMNMGPSLTVGGDVKEIKFFLRIHQSNKKGAKPVLDEFRIVDMSTIWIQMSGLGPLTWVLKYMLTGLTKIVEDFIVHKLTEKVRDSLVTELQKLSFPV